MKTRLVLSLLVVTLGACSTSPADLKPVNDLDATARTQLKDPGAPETAVATWDRAVAALQPSSEGYFATSSTSTARGTRQTRRSRNCSGTARRRPGSVTSTP